MVLAKRSAYIRNREIAYCKIKNLDKSVSYWVEVINWKGKIEQSYTHKTFERALLCFHNMMINIKYT